MGLGVSPTIAMSVAEHLYISGNISYPMTETTAYPLTFDLHSELKEQAKYPSWGRVVGYLLFSGGIGRPEGGRDVGDHPPITHIWLLQGMSSARGMSGRYITMSPGSQPAL